MKKIIQLFLFLCITISCFAQAPAAFNYQGVARDLAGNPMINQAISLRLTILEDAPTSSTIAYQEVQNTTTNNLGLFSLQIGGGTSNGNLADVNWGAHEHFLQIELDETGGTNYQLLGTSQLLSVPYALYAEHGGVWKNFDEISSGTLRKGISYVSNDSKFDFLTVEESDLSYPSYPQIRIKHNYANENFGLATINFIRREEFNDEPTMEFAYNNAQGLQRNFAFRTAGEARFFFKGNGNLGLGTTEPKATIHVADGDVYIEDINNGVILTSPNGQCWRMTVDNNGDWIKMAINCPN